jgi:hypothetical protein
MGRCLVGCRTLVDVTGVDRGLKHRMPQCPGTAFDLIGALRGPKRTPKSQKSMPRCPGKAPIGALLIGQKRTPTNQTNPSQNNNNYPKAPPQTLPPGPQTSMPRCPGMVFDFTGGAHSLSGPLAFSDSRMLPFGLGPETFEIRPRRAGF